MFDVADLQRARGTRSAFFGMAHPDNEPGLRYAGALPVPGGAGPAAGRLGAGGSPRPAGCSGRPRAGGPGRGARPTFRPDVVHLHNMYHQLSPSVVGRGPGAGVPCVMTLHDYKLACPTLPDAGPRAAVRRVRDRRPAAGARRRCKDGSPVGQHRCSPSSPGCTAGSARTTGSACSSRPAGSWPGCCAGPASTRTGCACCRTSVRRSAATGGQGRARRGRGVRRPAGAGEGRGHADRGGRPAARRGHRGHRRRRARPAPRSRTWPAGSRPGGCGSTGGCPRPAARPGPGGRGRRRAVPLAREPAAGGAGGVRLRGAGGRHRPGRAAGTDRTRGGRLDGRGGRCRCAWRRADAYHS